MRLQDGPEHRYSITTGCKSFHNSIDRLPPASRRLNGVRICNEDFEPVLLRHDGPDTLHYLDPPYVAATRVDPTAYAHELADADHGRLMRVVRRLRGKVIISGYWNPIYAEALNDWRKIEMVVRAAAAHTRVTGKTNARPNRLECLWLNF